MYQSKTSRNKALLMRRLVNLKLRSGDSVAVHSSEFQNLVNQLDSVGLKFDDELQALLLLSSLPDNWETLVVSLSNSATDGKLSMSIVKDALFNEEARRKEMGTDCEDESLALVSDGNRGRNQTRGNRRGGAAVKHGTSGIGCSVGHGVHQLPIRTWRERASTRRCHDSCEGVRDSGLKVRKQLMQDVHREAQRKGTGILRKGAPKTKKRVSFALDLVSGGDLSGVVDTGGGKDPPRMTYNCPSIEECFRQGLKARPKTEQELTNSLLTPNNLLKNIIDSLLDKMMSSSLSDQKSSAKTLRQLTKQYPPFRDLFGNEAVSKLLKPLDVPGNACLDLDLRLDIITTVFNISLPQGNKKVVAENLRVIPLLINALRTGTSKTKSNAAAALFKLSELDSNRTLIHESGALGPLIRLVKDGDFLDLLLPVLTTLSSLPSAAEEMGKMGAGTCLLKIMMESGDKDSNAVKSCAVILFDIYSFYKQEKAANAFSSCLPKGNGRDAWRTCCALLIRLTRESGNKYSNAVESCAAILFDICSYDKDELKEVKQEEAVNGTTSTVALGDSEGEKKGHWNS
ncbi:hypothetical protein RHSIM_Rhsim02G0085400 [Rhododendron simsii]|uniref:ARM repeat superfamily protein n=1 Tax=Rhododendron simsii TaxID=118357 RepID=A0A834LTN0_RHOSS|nr:hypothetical protein RHSIM_Rhsim02G0085400 [Rhododendron simsii]